SARPIAAGQGAMWGGKGGMAACSPFGMRRARWRSPARFDDPPPTGGRVLPCARVWIVPSAPDYTLPLVGRAGEGVEADAERATIRPWTKRQESPSSVPRFPPPGGLAYRLPHRDRKSVVVGKRVHHER